MKEKLEAYKVYLININRSLVYFNYLRPLFNYLEINNIDFYSMSKDQLAKYFQDKEYKPNAINSLLNSCRDFCRYENITEHCCFQIKSIEIPNKLPEYITLEEIDKVVKNVSTYNSRLASDKVAILLYFMFYTGVRKSEILNLKRENFDLTNCEVKIYEEKTKQEKIIYYPDKLVKKLTDYFNTHPEEDNAFNVTYSQINYLFREVMTKILGRQMKPHLTRHGGARYMDEKGVSVTIIQRILGHKNINTTLRYLNPDQKMIERIYKEKIK